MDPKQGLYYRGESTIENNQSVTVKLPDYVRAYATNSEGTTYGTGVSFTAL